MVSTFKTSSFNGGEGEENPHFMNNGEIEVKKRIGRVVRNNHIDPLCYGTRLQDEFFLVTWRGEVNLLPKGSYFMLSGVMRLDFPYILWFSIRVDHYLLVYWENIREKIIITTTSIIPIRTYRTLVLERPCIGILVRVQWGETWEVSDASPHL